MGNLIIEMNMMSEFNLMFKPKSLDFTNTSQAPILDWRMMVLLFHFSLCWDPRGCLTTQVFIETRV